MPIWKVSFTDGMFQVADADGALYPLTTGGQPITRFNEGWSPRGLQTGLPPLHVLELEHTSGDTTIWLHDESLDYRANAVLGLSPGDQEGFFAELDPIVRILYAECVLAPHAAIPSAAHRFDGMLPRTVALLIGDSINRTMPSTDLVVPSQLRELGTGYGNGSEALSADWIRRAFEAPAEQAQERFEIAGRPCARFLDPAGNTVFYRFADEKSGETALFVPQARVLFAETRPGFDPLHALLQYYAGNTNRAVSLPEALDVAPVAAPVVPPQHGLDEPPEVEPASAPVHDSVALDDHAHESVLDHSVPHEAEHTVFEAPVEETPHHATVTGYDEPETVGYVAPAPVPAAAPKQNWWQRLLGLGNP